ncbi:MAG: lipopolysaccharide heptosyltransferase family protein [Acidobacteria bacterium]|nr:MAG: lipopolysaccharide heptosyltransferase family protein [Acidobacteriota bacterium]
MKSVLVIKLSSVGDVVMATAAVSHLKAETGASITWIVDEGMASILDHNPLVDRLLLYPRDPFHKDSRTALSFTRRSAELVRTLLSREYDLAIDLQGRPRTYLLLQAARAGRKIGRGLFPLLPQTVRHRRSVQRHAVLACFETLDLLGLPRPAEPRLFLPSTREDCSKVGQLLTSLGTARGRYAVILPATTWRSKTWPAEHWTKTADWLIGQGLDVILLGSSRDLEITERIRGNVKKPGRLFPLLGCLNLRELLPLFQGARLVLGGDTGPVHIAAATEVPIVALYGASDPLRTGPWPPGRALTLTAPGCRACRLPQCRRKCMPRLLPDQVIAAVEGLGICTK